MKEYLTLDQASEVLGKSKETLRRWDNNGKLNALREPGSNYRVYKKKDLQLFLQGLNPNEQRTLESNNKVKPLKTINAIELFAGAGGLGLGLEKAGIKCLVLNEYDKWACKTLRKNRPNWNVLEGDIKNFSFSEYENRVDLVTGGFPCQAFSYAGKKLGFLDTRGTLFYEYARVIKEVKPKILLAENVRGLKSHDQGRTLKTMVEILKDLGYHIYSPQVLNAVNFFVPQKRERLIIIGVRNDIKEVYEFPKKHTYRFSLSDALKKGVLFDKDVPESSGSSYPQSKKVYLEKIPPKGYWRDLPIELQKSYMGKSFYQGGGKTGMARRIGWDEPCLTLTCSPAQKQTERCHPDETRPFTVREYARIQTFPDDWSFQGSISQQYKQIGNAVPVNLAREIGYSIIKLINQTIYNSSKPL